MQLWEERFVDNKQFLGGNGISKEQGIVTDIYTQTLSSWEHI